MKKKYTPLESALEKSDLLDTFAEHPAVLWISQNGRNLLWLILGVITLLLIGYRLMGGASSGSLSDYFAAEKEMNLFLADKGESGFAEAKESLNRLTQILNRYPDLHAKYDGQIAQELLLRGDIATALPFADQALARLSKEHLPLYSDYSATTLLIEKGQISEALEQAVTLQTKWHAEEQKIGSGLFAMNLMRIAMLNQKLGKKREELTAWQTFKQALQGNSTSVLQILSEGRLSILDYIAYREKEIN